MFKGAVAVFNCLLCYNKMIVERLTLIYVAQQGSQEIELSMVICLHPVLGRSSMTPNTISNVSGTYYIETFKKSDLCFGLSLCCITRCVFH